MHCSPQKKSGDSKNGSKLEQKKPRKRAQARKKPSKTTPMLPFGTVIKDKYRLDKIVGAGGYGQILKATDIVSGAEFAVKMMPDSGEVKRMIQEQQILRKLKATKNSSFPIIQNSGTSGDMMFIVMQLLGRSISDLRKKCEGRKFDPPTAIRVGLQGLASLKALHEIGFVHRDVKPGNMCIGATPETTRMIYSVDFGLARCFKANGKLLKKRNRAGFRGTLRYVSVNVHEHKDQCPCDDLISVFYTIIELSEGVLPWSKLRDSLDIARKKKLAEFKELTTCQPEILWEFYSACADGDDANFPNYDDLQKYLKECLPKGFEEATTPMSYEKALVDKSGKSTISKEKTIYGTTDAGEEKL